jgi:micrococcal nuclease
VKKSAISGIIGAIALAFFMGSYYLQLQESTLCEGSAECISGKITQVIDGDTIVIDDIHVRLALTSTPELDETYGMEAKEFTESVCPVGSDALVDEDDMQTGGSFGRMVGLVKCGDTVLNSALLERSLGKIDTRFCDMSEFAGTDWAGKFGC